MADNPLAPAAMREALSRKVGPLPIGGWLAIAAVGVAAAIILARRRQGGAAKVGVTPAVIDPDTGKATDPSMAGRLPSGGFTVGAGPASATGQTGPPSDPYGAPVVDVPKTNDDWAAAAQRLLISKGYAGTAAGDAIGRYLDGLPVTAGQASMIDLALTALGPTPARVPGVTVLADSTPATSIPAPAAAPEPAAYVTDRKVVRWDGGPDGPGSFIAFQLVNYSDGSTRLVHIVDGNEYAALLSSVGETKLDTGSMVALINSSTKVGAPPRWLPPGARWS